MQQWIPFTMALIAVGSLGTTIYFGRQQLKNAKRLLSVQLAVEFDKQFDSERIRKSRERIAADILAGKEPSDENVLGFFETIGYYSKMGAIDMETVWNDFSYPVLHYWPALRGYVKKIREKDNDKYWYENFEWLYYQLVKKNAERLTRAIAHVEPDQEAIKTFLEEESDTDIK